MKNREIRRSHETRSDRPQHESVGEYGNSLFVWVVDGVSKSRETAAKWRMFETQVDIIEREGRCEDRDTSDE